MQTIHSAQDPRLSAYQLLKAKEEPSDKFIADHEKTAVRLLNSNLSVESIFCMPKYWEKHKNLIQSKEIEPNKCFVADKSVFEETIGFSVHQGFMAVGLQKWSSLSEVESPILAVNYIVDSENIGSILRTAAAFGIRTVIFDSKSASPYLRRSVRVSMGSLFQIPLVRTQNLNETLISLKASGYNILSLSLPREGENLLSKTKSIYELKKQNHFVLVVGNESDGITKDVLDLSDLLIYIPMKNQIDSLNVSHALAVALSHLVS
ncbi:RNA methyltransferase [Leptospira sp. 2 VSF19]|uniref:RNA methyltransferase n=1 Tax=Leptospira soteropolitanensis TaxID=2950025 RepID=A0AAW5VGR3_9LEPT|nr:RNA methyltransferase [Leptospira soteropolitanensis]MCW7492482.1 RNA methyltransferase [Leptospira soteropolitanensis]MCW7500532.1 RNA methyltransferase [Leptospira soteropolitanensis]MCW7522798.1 RNA methyltransferase [Leptospira soteropolitanensis]MCW7526656.1 RNA methyltransferase [Leptospira soteropolitanensis]MCW7530502.1 RNA methyltransferase [Leptospira soteropolitanensis]